MSKYGMMTSKALLDSWQLIESLNMATSECTVACMHNTEGMYPTPGEPLPEGIDDDQVRRMQPHIAALGLIPWDRLMSLKKRVDELLEMAAEVDDDA